MSDVVNYFNRYSTQNIKYDFLNKSTFNGWSFEVLQTAWRFLIKFKINQKIQNSL